MQDIQEKRENKYVAGDIVYAKNDPNVELVVRRFVDRIYYCGFPHNSERKELVFFERELV